MKWSWITCTKNKINYDKNKAEKEEYKYEELFFLIKKLHLNSFSWK